MSHVTLRPSTDLLPVLSAHRPTCQPPGFFTNSTVCPFLFSNNSIFFLLLHLLPSSPTLLPTFTSTTGLTYFPCLIIIRVSQITPAGSNIVWDTTQCPRWPTQGTRPARRNTALRNKNRKHFCFSYYVAS